MAQTATLSTSTPEAFQRAVPLHAGLTAYVGSNPDLAALASVVTGEKIAPPFRTLQIGDDEGDWFLTVFHGAEWVERSGLIESRVWIAYVPGGLRLPRAMFRIALTAAFREEGIDQIAVRIPVSSLDARSALERIGFRPAWREVNDGDCHLVMILRLETLSPAMAGLLRRPVH